MNNKIMIEPLNDVVNELTERGYDEVRAYIERDCCTCQPVVEVVECFDGADEWIEAEDEIHEVAREFSDDDELIYAVVLSEGEGEQTDDDTRV